jgi:uncharacterized protein YndB with AHSA1/START domain
MTARRRVVGQTRDAGFQVGVRRSLPITPEHAWELVTSRVGVQLWLGDTGADLGAGASYRLADGTTGEVTVYRPGSHLRLTWHPPGWPRPSIVQVRVIAGGASTALAFHHEHLPGSAEREARRAHYAAALDALERAI